MRLQISGTADVTVAGQSGAGDVNVMGRLDVTTPVSVGGIGPLTVRGLVSTVAGSTLSVANLTVFADSLKPLGTYAVGLTQLLPVGLSMRVPVVSYNDLATYGNASLVGNTTIAGQLAIGDSLTVGGHTLRVRGDLVVVGCADFCSNNSALLMLDPADSVIVGGQVTSWSRRLLQAGVLTIAGNLFGIGASGTHKTVLNGVSSQVIRSCSFQDLDIGDAAGGVAIDGPITVSGRLIATAPVARTVKANPGSFLRPALAVAGLNVSQLILDDVRLAIRATSNTALTFDNVVFQNYSPVDTQFTIVHPGDVAPFIFNNLTFSLTPTTGLYVYAVDADQAIPLLSITIITSGTPSATQGQAFTRTDGIAQVRWQ